jgi:hypothetical protein
MALLKPLEYHTGPFPRQALEATIANRDEVIPELLKILEYTANHVNKVLDEPNYMAHLYALYLLAQFREERAYPLLIKLFSTPDEDAILYSLVGDVITEDLPRMLASVCGDDIDPIKALAENEKVDEFVRSAALRSLLVLVAQGIRSREEILVYFQSLFRGKLTRSDNYIWSSLVVESTDLYPDLVYEDIKQAFEDDLIDLMVIDLKWVDEAMAKGKEAVIEALKADPRQDFIKDTIAEMQWWDAFQTAKPIKQLKRDNGQVVREGRKVGRNDPCPCGSGLKYKRCCGKSG